MRHRAVNSFQGTLLGYQALGDPARQVMAPYGTPEQAKKWTSQCLTVSEADTGGHSLPMGNRAYMAAPGCLAASMWSGGLIDHPKYMGRPRDAS